MTDYSTTYIVGGGPSLRGFKWSVLANRAVIAINRAYEVLPDAPIVFFNDYQFFKWHKDRGLLEHQGRLITGSRDMPAHDRVERVKLKRLVGLTMTPGELSHGCNSGYTCINLAVQLGARHIFALGFDMRFGENGVCHWHNGYPKKNYPHVFVENMLPYFPSLTRGLSELGITCTIVGESALTCFPKISVEQFYEMCEGTCVV